MNADTVILVTVLSSKGEFLENRIYIWAERGRGWVTELKHLYLTQCLTYFLKFVVKYLY